MIELVLLAGGIAVYGESCFLFYLRFDVDVRVMDGSKFACSVYGSYTKRVKAILYLRLVLANM